MKPQSAPRHDIAQLDAAMQWVLRLRDEAVTDREIGEWLSWYEHSDAHKRAFDELQGLWHATGALAAGPAGAARIRRLARSEGAPRTFRQRYWVPAALAASAALLTLVTLWPEATPPPRKAAQSAAAPPIGVRTAALPDGSTVELAARTDVAVQYSASERLLEMGGGEAYFTVAPNRERPFIVKVGAVRVKAVGTAFNIRHAGSRTAVTVTEGVVEVGAGAAAAVRVSAGNMLTLASAKTPPQLARSDAARALAWREGRLEYINEPLHAVIADVNRYTTQPVTIDAAVAHLTFTGTVFTASAEDWLQALPREFPLEVVTTRDGRRLVASTDK